MQCVLNVMVFGTLFLEIFSVGGNNKMCFIFKLVFSHEFGCTDWYFGLKFKDFNCLEVIESCNRRRNMIFVAPQMFVKLFLIKRKNFSF